MKTSFRSVITVLLSVLLFAEIYALSHSEGSGGVLPYSNAQSVIPVQDNGNQMKEIEQVFKDSGMPVSPNDVLTNTRLPWEYGNWTAGDSGIGTVEIWTSEADASASFSKRAAASTQDSSGYPGDSGYVSMKPQKSVISQNGVVWYNPGTGVYLATGTNKVYFTGTAEAVFVCGKVTLYGNQVRAGPILAMPADGIKGPDALSGGGENQNYKTMKTESDKLSKQASDDLAQRLQNVVNILSSKGLCTGVHHSGNNR